MGSEMCIRDRFIQWYDSNASQTSTLVDGAALGLTSEFTGIELIERAHTSGDITLDAGTLLLTTAGASSLGSNNIAADSFDVVALNLSSTGFGSTAGTASIVFDGSDVGLPLAEQFNSLSLETVPDVQTDETPITDLSSGIELNTDGGNDSFLVADGGAILGGLTSVTYEVQFAADPTNQPFASTLFSYAAENDIGNDFRILIHNEGANAGSLFVTLNGNVLESTGLDYRSVIDGDLHALGFSWDSTSGDWAIYVNGVEVDSGSGDSGSGFSTGETFAPGGTLVFGLSLIHI